MRSQKVLQAVTPAQAGVQKRLKGLDSRLRGNDKKERFSTFYEFIKFDRLIKRYHSIEKLFSGSSSYYESTGFPGHAGE